jgi:hypothetical protein
MLDYLRLDLARAEQGNVSNPWKAAVDGVWRDLRTVLREAVEFGGLTTESHQIFLSKYFPLENRIAVGFNIETTKKLLALIDAGIVDISFGPNPDLECTSHSPPILLKSQCFPIEKRAHAIVCSFVKPFDLHSTASVLYRNLASRGIVRPWKPAIGQHGYSGFGPVEVTPEVLNPIGEDGGANQHITLWGVPTEGLAFFTYAAARPGIDCNEINVASRWAINMVATILQQQVGGEVSKWKTFLYEKAPQEVQSNCARYFFALTGKALLPREKQTSPPQSA